MGSNTIDRYKGIGLKKATIKRLFDVVMSFIGLVLCSWIIVIAWIVAFMETGSNGFFLQPRIGRFGKSFSVIKIKTMHNRAVADTTVTTLYDKRLTKSGSFFRTTKIDELPQLFNVLIGDMSFVGPRPDVTGYADMLNGDDEIVLSVRPGITGPATLKYRSEEVLLSKQQDPESYNKEIIYPDKVLINKNYIRNYSFWSDLQYIYRTLLH